MIDIRKKLKQHGSIKLSIYFAFLASLLIVILTSAFAAFLLFNLRNVARGYESEMYKLRYSLSTMLVQAVMLDKDKKNFLYSKKIINILKNDNLLIYTFVKDNKTNKTILGDDEEKVRESLKAISTMSNMNGEEISKDIGEYTIYFGIPTKNINLYSDKFIDLLLQIFFTFISLGILGSFAVSGVILAPLEKLSKAAKEITDGNFDVKIENSNFSEINDLIFSYNEMAFQLNELYTSLELKVQERTIALEEANYKLQETQAMMVHSEKMRSLGELVAGIAHEINNPINFIHGNIMILQNYVDDVLRLIDFYESNNSTIPQDIKEQIENIKKEIDLDFIRDDVKDLIRSCIEGTQRTKNIILDLKNFSRMEEMVLTQFDIHKEIDTTLNILNNKYKNRIEVIKNYYPHLPKIEAYGGQLNQVFMNILDNAQDAMGEHGTLTINTYDEGEKVKIEFIDTGSGIAEENLKKVFDPFFTTKVVGKGTGLGMSISYRVIKDHKGTITIDSKVGEGTKFTIILPINHNENEKTEEEKLLEDLHEEHGAQ